MGDKPNYYAVLPANVRYDNRLANFPKLLYAEISALCNKEGYCWASNQYFSELYDCTHITITRALSQLIECGYISRELIQTEQNHTKRILRITISKKKGGSIKNDVVGGIKNDVPINKNKFNNTININAFSSFWDNLKGRKHNKKTAMKTFSKIQTGLTPEQLANKYNLMFGTREEKYIPYPAKWLENEGWKEDIQEVAKGGEKIYRDNDGYIISKEAWESTQKFS